jgi:PAS domain S-box-containing protein
MSQISHMNKKDTIHEKFNQLRRHAEHEKFNQLRRHAEQLMKDKDFISPLPFVADPLELIHELQTFQVELELQNEELHRSQQELMEFKKRYTELYDFTPVGYICLDKKGVIRTANLTLADMLSAQRSSLINQAFSDYVLFEDQDIFYRHIRDLAEVKTRQICELRMRKKDGTPLDVQLESTVISYQSDRPEQYRTVIIDISARKQMEKEK